MPSKIFFGIVAALTASVYYCKDKIQSTVEGVKSLYEFNKEQKHMTTGQNIFDICVCGMKITNSLITESYNNFMSNATIHKSFVDIEYRLSNGKKYKFRMKHRFSAPVTNWVSYTDSDGNDITHVISPYLGPYNDFHGISYSPKMLGYDSITVKIQNESFESSSDDIEIRHFSGKDVININ